MLEVKATNDFVMTPLNDWAFEVMCDACSIFDEYWLESGTILGLYRDNDFLPGDHDIDIGTPYVENIKYDLPMEFIKKGFLFGRYTEIDDKIQQFVFTKFGNLVDVWVWYNEGEMLENVTELGLAKQPYSLFNPLGKYEFKGEEFSVPNDIEKYLEVRFKDWKTPANGGMKWDKYASFLS